jgi:hypothetical protein
MHLLHQALDGDGQLQDIIGGLSRRIAENPLKHAIVLDLNPFWLACYRLSEAGLAEELIDTFSGPVPFSLGGGGGYIDLSRRDFKRSAELTNRFFGGKRDWHSPYLLRIFARPTPGGESTGLRQQLVNVAREAPLATIVETQEPARLLAAPGDRVTSSSGVLGTLGGFLLDTNSSTTFAVTCGHVISAGTASVATGSLGSCVHAKTPVPLPPGTACTSSCGAMTELDVALIDVSGSSAANVAKSIAATVAPTDIVDMNGATSGHRTYEVGGAVVEHSIGGACWDRLYLFHAPVTGSVLHPALKVAMTPPPDDGDSGSWLLRNADEWAGMVVAGNALHGYALAGTTVMKRSDGLFGTQLKLA